MFTFLLNLFGCNKKVAQSQPKLTASILDTIPNDQLLQTVFDHLSQTMPNNQEEYEAVMHWNKSKQAIYMIWLLEGEVNNGGYNQFYFNSSGVFAKHLPGALRLVGAHKYAALTQQANDIYEAENEKITQHQDGTLEGFSKSYEDNPLNELDDRFYALSDQEDLAQLQIDYIRKHKQDFVSP